jgi:hypothetical protein
MSRVDHLGVSDRIPAGAAQDGGQKANRLFFTVNLRRVHLPESSDVDTMVDIS